MITIVDCLGSSSTTSNENVFAYAVTHIHGISHPYTRYTTYTCTLARLHTRTLQRKKSSRWQVTLIYGDSHKQCHCRVLWSLSILAESCV